MDTVQNHRQNIDDALCEDVVNAALQWHVVISSGGSSHNMILHAEYALAKATDRLMEHRS